MVPLTELRLDWGAATATLPGEAESGDRFLVCTIPGGTLLAAVDGLGHGPEAACASRVAIETLAQNAQESVVALLKRCHKSLRPTRGAVMSLAAFNAGERSLTWVGVGNVEGILLRADPGLPNEKLLLRSGVVGAQLPQLQAAVLPVGPGDVLVFATDGVDNDFLPPINAPGSLQVLAEGTLARHGKRTDDALVLLARFASAVP